MTRQTLQPLAITSRGTDPKQDESTYLIFRTLKRHTTDHAGH